MLNSFRYAGKASTEFGVYISGAGTFAAPEREVEVVTIPGKNGDLLYDNKRYRNTEISYRCGIVKDFESNFKAFRNWILSRRGYQRLTDSYHPNEFYQAYVLAELNPELTADLKAGEFTMTFSRKPERYLIDGEIPKDMTASGTIYNPTLFASAPLIRVNGTGTLMVNDTLITITGDQMYTDIDCEIQDAFYGDLNLNSRVTVDGFEFPKLEPGENTITLNGVTIQITPRWYIL